MYSYHLTNMFYHQFTGETSQDAMLHRAGPRKLQKEGAECRNWGKIGWYGPKNRLNLHDLVVKRGGGGRVVSAHTWIRPCYWELNYEIIYKFILNLLIRGPHTLCGFRPGKNRELGNLVAGKFWHLEGNFCL